TGRDSRAACELLQKADLSCEPCCGIEDLQSKLTTGAGVAILAEEAFVATDPIPLFDWVRTQPPWSDFPFIVLTNRHDYKGVHQHAVHLRNKPPNVPLLDRPLQAVTLISAAKAAWRSRQRQYKAAASFAEREEVAARLEGLVRERTH